MFKRAFLPFGTLLLVACASTGPTAAHRIAIGDTGEKLEVTVPLSKLIMSLPKGELRLVEKNQGGATASPRYFYLEDRSSGTILSGWFEPAERVSDLQASWTTEMDNLRKRGFGPAQDVESGSVGPMRTILYALPAPRGSSVHIRASYVRAGTWVDLHASVTRDIPAAAARERVLALMRSIEFREKP